MAQTRWDQPLFLFGPTDNTLDKKFNWRPAASTLKGLAIRRKSFFVMNFMIFHR